MPPHPPSHPLVCPCVPRVSLVGTLGSRAVGRRGLCLQATPLALCVPRQRPPVELPFEESERRALLLKKWSLYKQREHELERAAIASLLEAQREALQELELTAPELHAEATKRDSSLFPFERQGPDYTPPIANYQPPEGRYQDITKVYTQVEFKR